MTGGGATGAVGSRGDGRRGSRGRGEVGWREEGPQGPWGGGVRATPRPPDGLPLQPTYCTLLDVLTFTVVKIDY